MTEDLLKCLYSYKVSMDYKCKESDGNKVQLRVEMARIMVKKVLDQLTHIFQMMRKWQRKNEKNKNIKLKIVKVW